MQFVTIVKPKSLVGLLMPCGQRVMPLDPSDGWPGGLLEMIKRFDVLRPRLAALSEASGLPTMEIDQVQLDAPIRNSEKLICIGKNYADHAREMGGDVPEIPVVFSKFASAINAPGAAVVLPDISEQVDFEAELVVVIGKQGRNVAADKAMEHVFGYCCGNDISARDWQKGKPGGQWLMGKTFDTFAPLGPAVVTADEVGDPHDLSIQLRLNGETMQSASTSDLIFRIDFLIEHVTKFFTLRPGDLIFTGTPSGVGAGRNPQLFLKAGDQLEVEIENLGVLANQVNDSAS